MRDSGGMEFLLRLLATMAGIWVSARLIPDISFTSGASLTETALTLAVIALVFTGVNSIIKPIVKTLTFPLYLLSFGLFAIVTNSVLFTFFNRCIHQSYDDFIHTVCISTLLYQLIFS